MSERHDVAPATLGVELSAGGVAVRYLDGREVFYHGVPARVDDELETPPGKDVHVLVTDGAGTEGVMYYVNDRKTHDDILADTGVGRVLLDGDDSESLFPGVEVARRGYGHRVTVDHEQVDGRVFCFVEDEFDEAAYEFVEGGPDGAS